MTQLRDFASEIQIEFLDAVAAAGSIRGAARALGKHPRTISKSLKRLEISAAKRGWSPEHQWTHPVPEGFGVGRMSLNLNAEGKVLQKWVIATPDRDEQLRQMAAAVEAMNDNIKPVPAMKAPPMGNHSLVNLYTITDYHFGMSVRMADGGKDEWNLEIAEDLLVRVFENLIARSPDAGTAIFNQLGDLFHFDGLEPVTPTSHHVLDAASRYEEMVHVVIRALRRVMAMLLTKHNKVILICAEGNHDLASSAWLRQMFAVLYENEPRVEVVTTALPYYAVRFGKVFLGFSHGHKKKKEGLPLLFAAMFREMFGQTTVGYIHVGHEHHTDEKEYPGFKVIQHPTLAAPDPYAMRGGWMSEREASVITYHADGYQVGRTTVTPEMLEAA